MQHYSRPPRIVDCEGWLAGSRGLQRRSWNRCKRGHVWIGRRWVWNKKRRPDSLKTIKQWYQPEWHRPIPSGLQGLERGVIWYNKDRWDKYSDTATSAKKETTNTRDRTVSVTEGWRLDVVEYDNTWNIWIKCQATVIVQPIYAFSWVIVVTVALKVERQGSRHPEIVCQTRKITDPGYMYLSTYH